MIYVSCFHNLYAIAWPDSLEAVENIAKREFFSVPLSALCGARRGGQGSCDQEGRAGLLSSGDSAGCWNFISFGK